ncbi:MAG: Rpp14/Pop5 family protein [Candidatus Woesearchaeota archaeon]
MKPILKSLKPSARENKRYMIVRGKNLKENIEKAILDFSGVLGMSKTGLAFIELNNNKDSAIIAVNREAVNIVRASLVIFKEKMNVERVSGTLRGLGK